MNLRATEVIHTEAPQIEDRHLKGIRGAFARGVQLLQTGKGTAADGARMIFDSIKLERLILGEAESRHEHVVSLVRGPIDMGLLTEEERAELQGLLRDENVGRVAALLQKARKAS